MCVRAVWIFIYIDVEYNSMDYISLSQAFDLEPT